MERELGMTPKQALDLEADLYSTVVSICRRTKNYNPEWKNLKFRRLYLKKMKTNVKLNRAVKSLNAVVMPTRRYTRKLFDFIDKKHPGGLTESRIKKITGATEEEAKRLMAGIRTASTRAKLRSFTGAA